jgi:hypothetical protein
MPVETSSSAGDWTGVIFQKIGEKTYAIPFEQVTNFPRSGGFTVYTDDFYFTKFEGLLTDDVCSQVIHNIFMAY